MAKITDHECIENERGELALLLHPIDEEVVIAPTFVIDRAKGDALLNLGGKIPHKIIGLNRDILDKLCAAKALLVIEMKGDKVVRTYDASVGTIK